MIRFYESGQYSSSSRLKAYVGTPGTSFGLWRLYMSALLWAAGTFFIRIHIHMHYNC